MAEQQQIHRLGARARSLPRQIESVVSFWLQKCAGRAMPYRDDFPVSELRPWLGHLALIEQVSETHQYLRLSGTELIRRFGREATGLLVDELAPDIAHQMRAILRAVTRATAPMVATSSVPLGRTVYWHCDVALPLATPVGKLGTVLFCSYPIREG
jgi:hypothetical protein